MTSSAHALWLGPRRSRINSLNILCSNSRAASIELEQLEWSLLLRVAAEFQAYCLDIHSLVVDELLRNTATETPGLETVLRAALRPTQLLTGSPRREKIESDFARLGVPKIWKLVGNVSSTGPGAVSRLPTLDRLLSIRNAISHGQYVEIQPRLLPGETVHDFVTVTCLPDLDALVDSMDETLSIYIDGLLNVGRPW